MPVTKKPDKTTMEGMIWHANDILQKAISSETSGIPKNVVQNCKGVVIVSVVEVGAIFSGTVGSGIVLAKDATAEGIAWSPPCACSLSGVGFGLMLGRNHKDMLIFLMDTPTLQTFMADTGYVTNAENTHVLGEMGRTSNLNLDPVNDGCIAVAFANGVYAGVSINGASFKPNGKANNLFYGRPILAQKILEGVAVKVPEDKVTLIDDVYKKLDIVASGGTAEPDAAEDEKVVAAASVAEVAQEKVAGDPDVVIVDAKVEAEKGN